MKITNEDIGRSVLINKYIIVNMISCFRKISSMKYPIPVEGYLTGLSFMIEGELQYDEEDGFNFKVGPGYYKKYKRVPVIKFKRKIRSKEERCLISDFEFAD